MSEATASANPTRSFYSPNDGANFLGTSGADALWGISGATQRMVGGAGDDTYYVRTSGNLPVEATGQGTDTVVTWMSYTLGTNLENLTVSAANTRATGNELANVIKGSAGTQTINGMAGNDRLTGGADADIFVVARGNGSDTITDFAAVPGGDTLRLSGYGFANVAAVRSAATQVGSDTVIALGGGETLTIKGVSLASFQSATITLEGPVVLQPPPPPPPPPPEPNPIAKPGAAPNNWVNGTSPTLTGTDKNDAIYVSNGTQTLIGGKGDDLYSLHGRTNTVVEKAGEGTDTVEIWSNYTLGANVENLTIAGSDAYGRGNELNNVLKGGSGDQTLNAEKGNDVLSGGAGSDTFTFDKGDGSDVITDFQVGAGGDVLRLNGYGFANVGAVKAAATQVGADTVIALGNGETLTLKNVTASALTKGNVAEMPNSAGLDLLFEDNFNSLSLRGAQNPGGTWKTTFYYGGRTLERNGEHQWYMDPEYKGLGVSPFGIQDGALTITATKTPEAIKAQVGGHEYLSGLVTSEQSFSTQYGYFEMRADLPSGQAMWPAWWLLPVNGIYPMEIDIFEVMGSSPGNLHTTVHTNQTGTKTATGDNTGVADMSDGFHTYGLDWGPEEIVWYFDGVEVFRAATPADMHDPMYMLMNLAVGGWEGGPNGTTLADPTMTIDYVRVYERPLDHVVKPIPTSWAAKTHADFSTMDGTGAVTKWGGATINMTDAETKIRMGDQWGRFAFGNDKNNYIEGANGQYNEIDGKGGDDVLKGNGGVDVFVIKDGAGDDTILDLGGQDKVELNGFHFSHFADVEAWMTQQGSDVLLRLDEDQALLLKDVRVEDLGPENFYFINVDPVL
jgi:beta-glucanase (GH16 family)